MYLSRSANDQPIAVTGTVFAPSQTTDPSIVAWAHGTTGLGDACTPSKMAAGGEGSEVLLGTAVVSRGLVFVATDYEGLGTPGVHTYLVGQSEGRAVLDSIRAARQLLELPATTKAVVLGPLPGRRRGAVGGRAGTDLRPRRQRAGRRGRRPCRPARRPSVPASGRARASASS